MRYVIKFTKENEIKFISHLDVMRTAQRVVRRAGLPVEYSQGFNPHMNMSIAQPLSVGMYSQGEYMDVVFTEEVDEKAIIASLNENAPRGIRFIEAVKVIQPPSQEKKIPQVMALIDAAEYEITIKTEDSKAAAESIERLMKEETWETLKKSKKGEKLIDIKPMVKKFEYYVSEENIKIAAVISCGSRENLSAELLSSFIISKGEGFKNAFVNMERKEMLAEKKGKMVPIYKYFN
ncbi:DUF2344 domain-containing protein [Clostridium sp. 19966]|uniref:TIGR03936 family radical SAM-associated protein n=1 Tax=Clostridium sp. 19966 TaxID=2768166 RepID=UPI0028DF0FCA|nr:TIGR03936 family radical SAM-associated protein [Clostridium sp. 19966]MDT8715283.1 DUF2344 domain-containing protein [Clostridium sp. 19966]